ncbi:MAG TPA: mercuric reductase [Luteimonas sp.]|nr:mercuric reductase [Luteimonas sp.]
MNTTRVHGTEAVPPDDSTYPASADDATRRELLENLRPPQWRNPQPAPHYALVVIGGGPAGLEAARGAAEAGVRVALVERELIGGDCLNFGCEPSKALIRTTRLYAEMREAQRYGAEVPAGIGVDFPAAMQRVLELRARLSRGDAVRALCESGIDVFFGQARFTGADALDVDGLLLRFEKALIATGGRPDVPAIPGLEDAGYYTNESIFEIGTLPRRLLVIGGGPLGCELAQVFCRFGSKTIIVQDLPLFLPREERDAAQILSDSFARDGIEVRLNTTVTAIRRIDGEIHAELLSDDYRSSVAVDAVLIGTGRVPRIDGMELHAAGIEHDAVAGIHVDDFLCTSNPRVYAAGDACLEDKFTHAAVASARVAVDNALQGGQQRLSALTVPWCTYTDPEIAHVGLYVREAMQQQIPVSTFTIPLHEVDRAVLDGEDTGFVKVHIADGSDRILGATIVARHAGEMISHITLAMVAGIGMRGLADVIHPYPTQAAAIGAAAQAYCRDSPAQT